MTGLARFWSSKDFLGGLLMLTIGLWAAAQGSTYRIGTLRSMGPGFFPVALGVILAGLGAVLAVQGAASGATATGSSGTGPGHGATGAGPEWRGWICLCAGIGLFILLGHHGGLLPATFAVVFVSALGDRRNTVRDAALLGAAASAVAAGVFAYALKIQFPLLSWG